MHGELGNKLVSPDHLPLHSSWSGLRPPPHPGQKLTLPPSASHNLGPTRQTHPDTPQPTPIPNRTRARLRARGSGPRPRRERHPRTVQQRRNRREWRDAHAEHLQPGRTPGHGVRIARRPPRHAPQQALSASVPPREGAARGGLVLGGAGSF